MYRTQDTWDLEGITDIKDFSPVEWLGDEKNIALTDGNGNTALFQYEYPGVVQGHYFFKARGREAINLSHDALKFIFDTGVETIFGLTPVDKKGARWLSRHIGFTSYDIISTPIGPCEMFVMHRKEYKWAA